MKNDNHNTGNIGLHYACYRLAEQGWNVMPTARNARGVDILVSGSKGKSKSIQVKTLSGVNPVNIKDVDTIDVEYLIVVMNARGIKGGSPTCYVLTTKQARMIVTPHETRPWIPVHKLKPYAERWKTIGTARPART